MRAKLIALGYRKFRAMSHAEYAALEANGGLSARAGNELFVSTKASYSRKFLQKEGCDVLVKFQTNSGTLDALSQIGVRNGAGIVRESGYGHLPKVFTGWMEKGLNFFKGEKGG